MSNALSFLLLISVAGAVWLARAWQQAEKRSLDLAADVAALEGERKDLIRRGDHESQARKKQSEELAELRRRADKAKRRAEKTPEAPLGTAARIRDVEVELERAQTALRRVEVERDQHARSAATLQAERDRLAKQLEDASAPARAVAEQGRAELERVAGRARGDARAVREAGRAARARAPDRSCACASGWTIRSSSTPRFARSSTSRRIDFARRRSRSSGCRR